MFRPYRLFRPLAVLMSTAVLALGAAPAGATAIADEEPTAAERSIQLYGADFSAESDYTIQDANASTDDRSVGVPTAWWFYTGVSASYVSDRVSQFGARITDVEIHSISSGTPAFTVRLVKNSGAYAVPGWWWYYGQTFDQIGTLLSSNNARLIDLEPYDAGGGTIRYAAVMVSNTGSAARNWSYLSGVTTTQISSHISSSGHRLIDLDRVGTGTTYSAVFVANTGSDAKTWQWWYNQSATSAQSRISTFGGRLVDLDRNPDGTYNIVMVKNTGSDAFAWWWYTGFTSYTTMLNYATQLGARPVDVETYLTSGGSRRYMAIFIDNSNAATGRIRGVFGESFLDATGSPTRGIFEAYLKRAGSTVHVDLNSARPAETASSLKALHLLHAMKRVMAGESLASAFVYYNYPSTQGTGLASNACPNPADETTANRKTDYNLEKGLDEMMRISDNRTTRGVVLRYGFSAINTTADNAGLVGTQLRHNIGCAYRNIATGKFTTSLRNDTTARDLATIYERVWNSTELTGTARSEFLESANPSTGVSSSLQTIINQEAAALGKSATVASNFGANVKFYSKGGSYGTCLPDSAGNCGQKVMIRSGAGIIRLPIQTSFGLGYRTYVFGRLISDVPTVDWTGSDVTQYEATYSKAANELYREEIRSALTTW